MSVYSGTEYLVGLCLLERTLDGGHVDYELPLVEGLEWRVMPKL